MKRKTLITTITFFWGIFCLTGYTSTAAEKAGQLKVINKIVIINQYEEIKPISITSQPGTTVIWVNHSRTPVEILFLDKKVTLVRGRGRSCRDCLVIVATTPLDHLSRFICA